VQKWNGKSLTSRQKLHETRYDLMCYYIIIIPTNQSYNWFEKLIAKINYNTPQEGENEKNTNFTVRLYLPV